LDIPKPKDPKNSVTLAECFAEFFKTETLDEWTCDDCKVKTKAEKIVRFWKAADVLVIVLKRFGVCKNKTPVSFPLEFHFLEDSVLCPEPQATKAAPYRLVAVANHLGGMMGGHYNATVRHGDTWFHVDDDDIRPLEAWNHNPMAYVLFYEKLRMLDKSGGQCGF
jgi:ubiquitin C-terminal hydrolase